MNDSNKPVFEIGEAVYRGVDIDVCDRTSTAFDTPPLHTIVKIKAETVNDVFWVYSYLLRPARSNEISEVYENELVTKKAGDLQLKMIENSRPPVQVNMQASASKIQQYEELKLKVELQMETQRLEAAIKINQHTVRKNIIMPGEEDRWLDEKLHPLNKNPFGHTKKLPKGY